MRKVKKLEVETRVEADIYLELEKLDGYKVLIPYNDLWFFESRKDGGTRVTYRDSNDDLISVEVSESKEEIENLKGEAENTLKNLNNDYRVLPINYRLDYEDETKENKITLSYDNLKDLNGKCYFDFDMVPERLEIFKLEVTETEIIQHAAWCTSMNGDIYDFSDKLSDIPVKIEDTYNGVYISMIKDPNDIFLKEIPEDLYQEILDKIKISIEAFGKQDKWFKSIREPLMKKLNSL